MSRVKPKNSTNNLKMENGLDRFDAIVQKLELEEIDEFVLRSGSKEFIGSKQPSLLNNKSERKSTYMQFSETASAFNQLKMKQYSFNQN